MLVEVIVVVKVFQLYLASYIFISYICHFDVKLFMVPSNNNKKLLAFNLNIERLSLRQIEWGVKSMVQKGPVTKNGVFALINLFLKKLI